MLLEENMLSFASIMWSITNIFGKTSSLIPNRIFCILLIHKIRLLMIINQLNPAIFKRNLYIHWQRNHLKYWKTDIK